MKIAIRQALNKMLASREYNQCEAKQVLQSKGYAEEDVEAVLSEYIQKGWLSNQRYIEQKVCSLMARGYGPGYVKQVLQQSKLEACLSDFSWREAYLVARRKAGKKEGMALKRYLYRRGFTSEMMDD